jgi:hypothetical protein
MAWCTMARARATCAAGLKKHIPVLPTARWRALDTRSQVVEPRLLFFALKKSLTEHKQRVQPMARGKVAAAGLKKHLPVLPTARWRALDTTSQVAEPRQFFFA